MKTIFIQLVEWLKEMMVGAFMWNMQFLFDMVNTEVAQVAVDIGTSPANFSPGVFSMIRSLSENVIMPIAGIILTFIACYELIQLVISHNNLANFETWIFFKWIIKTFVAVELITHCFDITMAVFDVAQHVISKSGGLISGSTAIDGSALMTMQATLETMGPFELFGLWLEIFVVKLGLKIIAKLIFVIVYGRMIEIYLMVSLAPLPM